MQTIQLIKPLEKVIRAGHPWIFRNALSPFNATAGEVVTVTDRSGRFLCRGLADEGPIGVRVFTTVDIPVDEQLFAARILKAIKFRESIRPHKTTALRLIHGEGDLLPGLVLDQYGAYAVLAFDGQSLYPWQDRISSILKSELAARSIKTVLLRERKRHDKTIVVLFGELPVEPVLVYEHGMKLWVDLMHGQKTGMFLDHRDSRYTVRQLARNKRVLNLYGYTGGFSIAAGLGGAAMVTTVDVAPGAIALAQKNWIENGLNPSTHTAIAVDVETFMKKPSVQTYDLIIADPPSFAPNKKSLPGALKAYQMLHASVFRRIKSNGVYISASCSSHIRADVFKNILHQSALQSGATIRIANSWGAAADHPVLKGFPEGEYLKVFLVEVQKR